MVDDGGGAHGEPLDPRIADHLLADFGMRTSRDAEGRPVVEMPLTPRVVNPHGGLHGGLMMTLIECGAAGVAVDAARSEQIVAGDLTVRFLAPVLVGPARVVGRPLRAGRRSIVVDFEVLDAGAGGKVCASGSVGYVRLDDPPGPG